MKSKANLAIATVICCIATTAYGLCYLEQIVNCAKNGDNITGQGQTVTVEDGTTIANVSLYADADAWRIDTYSASRGGYAQTSFTSICDPITTVISEMGNAGFSGGTHSDGGGFPCHYYRNDSGSTGTCRSGGNLTVSPFSYYVNHGVSSHYAADSATLCN